jgi:hypothetical protein
MGRLCCVGRKVESRGQSTRCRDASSSNEGDKAVATRARWRVDCSGVKTSDGDGWGDAVELIVVAGAEAGDVGDEEDEGVAGDMGMLNAEGSSGVVPLAIPWSAPTTFSQAFSKTRTLSFNS